jgi:MinD-like ATPase involved in chromosome partitioning or flagellar assembly
MAESDVQVGNDRVSASEVRVDLREALSDVESPRPEQPNGQHQPPSRQQRPPIWEQESPRQRHPLPAVDQQPHATQEFNPGRQAPAAPQAVAEAEPPPESEDPLSTELLPADVYRIVDGHEVRDTPWTRFVGRARNMLTSPPARQEQELDQQLQQLRVRGLQHGVTVALGSIKGGVGKTTLTLSLADTLADALRCGVLVVDADLEWGTAADSTPQDGRRGATLTQVLAAHDQINSPGDLAPYLLSLPGGAQLLAGPTDPSEIEQIQAADMQKLLELLRRFFPVILLDLSPGIGLRGTIPRWAFGSSDEIVAIATPTRGSLRRAGRMLSYLSEHRPDVPITLALNMVPRRPDEASRRVIQVAERNGKTRRYAAIPRDDGLLRQLDAGLLNIDELDQLTRIAIKDLAFKLADGWCR